MSLVGARDVGLSRLLLRRRALVHRRPEREWTGGDERAWRYRRPGDQSRRADRREAGRSGRRPARDHRPAHRSHHLPGDDGVAPPRDGGGARDAAGEARLPGEARSQRRVGGRAVRGGDRAGEGLRERRRGRALPLRARPRSARELGTRVPLALPRARRRHRAPGDPPAADPRIRRRGRGPARPTCRTR